jgi:hypothetical protein
MGGPGSGHWNWGKKQIVERCLVLNVCTVLQANIPSGVIRWGSQASIGFTLGPVAGSGWELRLNYAVGAETIALVIWLTATRPHFGGRRWWFLCPSCGRRVGKLYLPPNEKIFACRLCHGLTYRSSQTSHKGVKRMLKDPGLLRSVLQRRGPGLMAALKAVWR